MITSLIYRIFHKKSILRYKLIKICGKSKLSGQSHKNKDEFHIKLPLQMH